MKEKGILSRKSASEKIVHIVVFSIMLLYSMIVLYVYAYGLNASLHTNDKSFRQNPTAIAVLDFEPYFKNYVKAFTAMEALGSFSFLNMLLNSVWYSIGGTLFSLSVAACSTYVVAKYKNKFTSFIFSVCLFIMIFPVVGAAPALYKLYKALGFDQTPLILLSGLNNMCHLMMYAFFSALPWTYAEAAFIDGANDYHVFFKIMLPMALPSISVLFVNGVIAMWNDYATPLLYLADSFPTLASGLFTFERLMQYQGGGRPIYFAGVCLAILPPVVLFSIMQNTIMTKVYFGGLKG